MFGLKWKLCSLWSIVQMITMQGLRHQLRAVDGHQGGDEGDCGPGHQDLPVEIDHLLQRAILLYCIMYIYIYML